MASDPRPSNPFLRAVRLKREQAQEALLAGTPTGTPADQVGIAFANYSGRYQTLRDLEEEFASIISKGETFDED
jgi:hypothetical protein